MRRLTKEQFDKAIGHKLSNENFYALILGLPLKHKLLKNVWIFFNSSQKVMFAQRDYTISRTLTIITESLKDGYNVLMEWQLNT